MQTELINPNPVVHTKIFANRGGNNQYDPNKLESADVYGKRFTSSIINIDRYATMYKG
jgi:hypothetical protein